MAEFLRRLLHDLHLTSHPMHNLIGTNAYGWYYDPIAQFPFGEKKLLLGRWLGVAACSIDIMALYILTGTGKVIVRKSIWGLSVEEMKTREVILQMTGLDLAISSKIGDAIADSDIDPA